MIGKIVGGMGISVTHPGPDVREAVLGEFHSGNTQTPAVLPSRGTTAVWIQPIQRLNCGFLVHAEDRGMLRRIHLQANDVCCLLLEVRIGSGIELAIAGASRQGLLERCVG